MVKKSIEIKNYMPQGREKIYYIHNWWQRSRDLLGLVIKVVRDWSASRNMQRDYVGKKKYIDYWQVSLPRVIKWK